MSNPLLDILPIGREVSIGRGKVQVVGVSLSFISKMIGRFPGLREKLEEGTAGWATAIIAIPEAIPMFCAAGIGKPGDKDAEDIFDRLDASGQLKLINEIIKETKGEGPFVEVVKDIAVTLGIDPARVEILVQSLRLSVSASEAEAIAGEPANKLAA